VVALDALQNPRLSELQNYVNDHRGQKIKVTIKRGSETLVKEIQPVVYEDTGKGGLGIAIAEIGTVRYPWYQAIYEGGKQTLLFLKEILFGFGALISDLFRGAAVGDQVSGPIGVAVMTGHVAKLGFIYLMQFTAMLSLNLAVLNILPIPALDGGRLLFVIIQKITKKGVAAKYEQIAHVAGFALLMLLVLVITVKDLSHFSGALSAAFHRVF
jgi:regulator of sigma E protease